MYQWQCKHNGRTAKECGVGALRLDTTPAVCHEQPEDRINCAQQQTYSGWQELKLGYGAEQVRATKDKQHVSDVR